MTTNERATRRPKRPIHRVPRIWNFVTNQQNMLYMLAAGMVMEPVGFAGKYYADTLGLNPGWIPLFRDTTPLPADALKCATSERKFLVPCVASFDLRAFKGDVRVMPAHGKERDRAGLPTRCGKNDFMVLVPAPLPLNLLTQITFRSQADKQVFETAATDVDNVDLGRVVVQVDESRFVCDTKTRFPAHSPQTEMPMGSSQFPLSSARRTDVQAVGGVLAMLYHTANRSDLGVALYRFAIGAAQNDVLDNGATHSFFAGLPQWLAGGKFPVGNDNDVPSKIYWHIVGALVEARCSASGKPAIDTALGQLEAETEATWDDAYRKRIGALAKAMRGCLGLGAGTITELFQHHRGSLSRSLLLFCLRKHCVDLLEFSHPDLTDADFAAAAILFGVRDGWIHMPSELRTSELSAFVSSRMAIAAHAARKHGVHFGTIDPPLPIRDRFIAVNGQWSAEQQRTALEFARRYEWLDCIQTRVTLQHEQAQRKPQWEGQELVIPGEATARLEVDPANFLARIARTPLSGLPVETALRLEPHGEPASS